MRRALILFILFAMSMALICGCQPASSPETSKDVSSEQSKTEASEPADNSSEASSEAEISDEISEEVSEDTGVKYDESLSTLRAEASDYVCAIAYLGNLPYLDITDEEGESWVLAPATVENVREVAEMSEIAKSRTFISQVPDENIILLGGKEVYLLVPVCDDTIIKFEKSVLSDGESEFSHIALGEPMILLCNESDIVKNCTVTLSLENEEDDVVFSPYRAITDGTLRANACQEKLYDFDRGECLEKFLPPPPSEEKVVYLTFDDGPSKYTQTLLDILDKYNVKATFFVVNYGYKEMIKEEYERGHAIGLHSNRHKYEQIYVSEEAYFADLKIISDLVYDTIGIRPDILRFPGGSSNGVSKKYNTGIMTRLTQLVQEYGYQYFDWNVSSGDAGDTTDTDVVYNNVITGIQRRKDHSIVLQHDSLDYSIAAVERIILWCLENGYTFKTLDHDSPYVHHPVYN